MSDSALLQIEDELALQIGDWPAFADWTILTDNSAAEAFEETSAPLISIGLSNWDFEPDAMQGQTRHEVDLEFEIVSDKSQSDRMGRYNINAVSDLIAALASDRTIGGLAEDIQEFTVASPGANGIDAAATVLVAKVFFYTLRGDWNSIVT